MTLREQGSILLVSCYELGHQPHGVTHPLAYLKQAGFSPSALDISIEEVDDNKISLAKFIGVSVPMHTALRLGVQFLARIRQLNPNCFVTFYGHYAALNSTYLFEQGAQACIGGEYETQLLSLVETLVETLDEDDSAHSREVVDRSAPQPPSMQRLKFVVPDRKQLPLLDNYAAVEHDGKNRTVGYTEASRGCLLKCNHCPIPPVYEGRFFVVPQEVVLKDIRQQVALGATHITFGDPDFLNGPKHSLQIVQQMHQEFPDLTFDMTAKVEHLLNRGKSLEEFSQCGCLFVISAVESTSNRVLDILNKEHTADDITRAIERCRQAGLTLRPTWVAFTPWTTRQDYINMLSFVETNELIDHVDPVQYTVRLLVPPGSWLENHQDMLPHRGELDEAALTYRWRHPDAEMDELAQQVSRLVEGDAESEVDPIDTFYRLQSLVRGEEQPKKMSKQWEGVKRAPRLKEPWFC